MLRHLNGGPIAGTQSSDVYSFGIIMSEVLTFAPAYANKRNQMTEQEIVDAVKKGTSPLTRPYVDTAKVLLHAFTLMSGCWSEETKQRPAFHSIAKVLKFIMKLEDLSNRNMMDSLLMYMEQYAANLEEIVGKYTAEFDDKSLEMNRILISDIPHASKDNLSRPSQHFVSVAFNRFVIADQISVEAKTATSFACAVLQKLDELNESWRPLLVEHECLKLETIGETFVVSHLSVHAMMNFVVVDC